jgi:Tat protein translocase TatB subunit
VGLAELFVVCVIALIVIPPEKLPEVMRTVGKVMRELRLASNTVVRELTDSIADPSAVNRPPSAIAKPAITEPPAIAASEATPSTLPHRD